MRKRGEYSNFNTPSDAPEAVNIRDYCEMTTMSAQEICRLFFLYPFRLRFILCGACFVS